MEDNMIEIGREKAREILFQNGGELGLLGSSSAYQQVWARDSMICGLGLLVSGNERGKEIHRRSLETLGRFQSELGKIPHNVGFQNVLDPALIAHGGKLDIAGEKGQAVEDSIHAGCVDGNLWYIIGHYAHFVESNDKEFLLTWWEQLEKALLWLRYQDSNECGLLEVHEAMDWADLFANRYNVLFDNVLYAAAWKCMGHMAEALDLPSEHYFKNAQDVKRKINTLLWITPDNQEKMEWIKKERKEWIYPVKRVETELVERPFYLPYMGFRDYADRFDTLANLLAIIFGIADEEKTNRILDYIHACGINEPFPVQALYPPIREGEKDWREYYRVRNLNLQHHYHNGGAWPFIGGFYVVALIQAKRYDEANYQLEKLTHMNKAGKKVEWEFNEWFHGQSGRPMGFAGQSWSAAMYLFAEDSVKNKRVNFFNHQHQWDGY